MHLRWWLAVNSSLSSLAAYSPVVLIANEGFQPADGYCCAVEHCKPCYSQTESCVCVIVLHNSGELNSSMTKQNHTFSCSSAISGLWFILGNLLNSRVEKGSSKEKFTAICVLPICTFSFGWHWGVGALEEFHCDTQSRFEDLSPSHSLWDSHFLWSFIQKHVKNIPPYRRESWTGEPSLALLTTLPRKLVAEERCGWDWLWGDLPRDIVEKTSV